MQSPLELRDYASRRTLEDMRQNYAAFIAAGSEKKKAKEVSNNIIGTPILDIPLDQVAPPVLHITLGVFQKLYTLLINNLHMIDVMLLKVTATSYNDTQDEAESQSGLFISRVKHLVNLQWYADAQISNLEESIGIANETYLEYCRASVVPFEQEPRHQEHTDKILLLERQLKEKKNEREALAEEVDLKVGNGPMCSAAEQALQQAGIQRQAYHSNAFVGNHVHKFLKNDVICALFNTVMNTLDVYADDNLLQAPQVAAIKDNLEKHQMVFTAAFHSFKVVDQAINNSKSFTRADIESADQHIRTFLGVYRGIDGARITPKLHLLEDHVIPFLSRWSKGLEFFGEQGGEKLHRVFNNIERNTNCCKGHESDKLTSTLKYHLSHVAPEYFMRKEP